MSLVDHLQNLGLEDQVSCRQLLPRAGELVNYAGYERVGISKYSWAAEGMCREARARGGGVAKLRDGGITAALQSIGASGVVKKKAHETIAWTLQRTGFLREDDHGRQVRVNVQLPCYFATNGKVPTLIADYSREGHNFKMAEEMLNECIADFCANKPYECSFQSAPGFQVLDLVRLENAKVFQLHKKHEAQLAARRKGRSRPGNGHVHPWLDRLADRNGLSVEANTKYMLHGTNTELIRGICNEGLQTRYSMKNEPVYGKGIYFADKSCKANQYTSGTVSLILVCRVVLGEVQVLNQECPKRLFPNAKFDSCMALGNHTKRDGLVQCHNEYIVYEAAKCYPEFVIAFTST